MRAEPVTREVVTAVTVTIPRVELKNLADNLRSLLAHSTNGRATGPAAELSRALDMALTAIAREPE